MKMRKLIALATAAVMTFAVSVTAFAADKMLWDGADYPPTDGNGADANDRWFDDGAFWVELKDDGFMVINCNFPETVDASDYSYIVMEIFAEDNIWSSNHFWMIPAGPGNWDGDHKVRALLMDYGKGEEGDNGWEAGGDTQLGSALTAGAIAARKLPVGEWTTVFFPIGEGQVYAWDSKPEGIDWSAIGCFRMQIMGGPSNGVFGVKNIRLSNSKEGGTFDAPAVVETPEQTTDTVTEGDKQPDTIKNPNTSANNVLPFAAFGGLAAIAALVVLRRKARA